MSKKNFLDRAKEVLGAAPADEIAEELESSEAENAEEEKESAKDEKPAKKAKKESKTEEPKEEPATEETAKEAIEEDSVEETSEEAEGERLTREEADEISAKIIEEALASEDDTEKPENPTPTQPKEARNQMRDFKFYSKIADKIYDFDRGLEMAPELRDWIMSAIEDDRVLSADFARKVLPKVLGKNPELVEDAIREAKKAENNKFVPFTVLFTNVKDTEDKNEYKSFKEACATIQKEIDTYGVDPLKVFKAFYRRIDAEGNLGDRVSVEEVEKYVDKFNGDKLALRKKLHLPKREKKPEQPNQPQNRPKNGQKSNKKADNGGNPAPDNAGKAAT